MTKRQRTDLTPQQWIAVGAVGAIVIGARLAQELRKSPSEKADDRRRHTERTATRRAYESSLKAAWKIDASRWRQFETDTAAQAAIEAERHVPIICDPADAVVAYERGDNCGHVWERITARAGDETLTVFIDHDGGARLSYAAPNASYDSNLGSRSGYVTIGVDNGPPTQLQLRTASLLSAIQSHGHLPGIISVASPRDIDRLERHYAAYATERGWPPEPYGEDLRVRNAYRSKI